ncbi:antitoxin [Corynebacterium lubricantis]|uniref:antitoxin n=1 Tax=Corynebacterium lubricantis TaxID=541095 RepID=UPI00035D7620|nr:antitoxin [Corynebacterium lubricantis]
MGIFDKAKDLLGDEAQTDAVLDKAEQFATEKLGADKADQIKKAREEIDKRIGDGDNQAPAQDNRAQDNRAQDNPER